MPELPEVETIARTLRAGVGAGSPSILGCRIIDAHLLWQRALAFPSPELFKDQIIGQSFRSLTRRGKYLVFTLDCRTLLIHLRMSGDLRLEAAAVNGEKIPYEKHDRLGLILNNGLRLVFNDTRKFGRAWLVGDPAIVLGGLGPEPLEESLSTEDFYAMLHGKRRQLKPLLMDQHFLAGLGNIYADEALHLARLHPLVISDQVKLDEAARLLEAIRSVLTEGILRNGASIDWVYRGGDFQNHFHVYGRTGCPCINCGVPIERLVVGQRGTHICPHCQKLC